MTRDDALLATMDRARDLGGLIMVHAENGDVVDLLVKRALARGDTVGDQPRAHAPGVRRGRGDRPRRAAGRVHAARRCSSSHVTCAAAAAEVEAAQQRGAARQRRDLHAVPRQHDRRPAPAGRRGRALHLLAAAARRLQPRAAVGLRPPRRARERLHRPLPVQLRAEVARAGQLQPRAQRRCPAIQHRLAKLWDEGVVAGRITPSQLVDRTSTTIARRFGLHDKGAIAPGQGRRHRRLRPARPAALRRRDVAHERRLRPLRGRDRQRQRAPHVLARRRSSTTAARSARARPRPLRRALGRRAPRWPHEPRDRRRPRPGRPARAARAPRRPGRRAAAGVDARTGSPRASGCSASSPSCRSRSTATWPATCGPSCPGDEPTAFVIVGSHIDAVPVGRLARRRARRARRARRRCARSRPASAPPVDRPPGRLGRRGGRALRPQPARLLRRRRHARPRRRARPARRARARGCRTRWPPAASTSTAPAQRARGSRARCAYLELHIEQGPVLLDSGRLASAVSGTFGDERYLITLHRPGRARGLDADAPAPRRARRRGDRGARDPRGRHPPRRRLHGRRDARRARRDHGGRGRLRDDARPAPPRCRRPRRDARRQPRAPARRPPRRSTATVELAARVRRDADAVPPAAGRARARGGRRRRRRRRAADPVRPAARRDRDRAARPDRDDLRPVRPAALAHRDRGLARGRRCGSRSRPTGARSARRWTRSPPASSRRLAA